MRKEIFCLIVALILFGTSVRSQSSNMRACEPIESDDLRPLALATGPILMEKSREVFTLGNLGFLVDPKGQPLKELEEYFKTVPGGTRARFSLMLEPVSLARPPQETRAPVMEGFLSWDAEVEAYLLSYGARYEKRILFFTTDKCLNRALERKFGPVRLTIIAPSSTS